VTTAELARLTMLSPRTIRRYVQLGVLNPRRRLLGGYDFSGDDIDNALIARDLKQRRLELVGPGLARRQQRYREGERSSATGLRGWTDDVREPIPVRCPRCGYTTGLRHGRD
jgi:DNA-binding transcriptional MerR regulator